MLRTHGIAHFTLPVTDMERSIEFYTSILGLELVRAGKQLTFLRSGKDHLVLAHSDAGPLVSADSRSARQVHQAFIVETRDFDESVRFLRDSGVNVIYEDERMDGSVFQGRSAYFYDPDRNVLEIIDLAASAYRPMPERERERERAAR